MTQFSSFWFKKNSYDCNNVPISSTWNDFEMDINSLGKGVFQGLFYDRKIYSLLMAHRFQQKLKKKKSISFRSLLDISLCCYDATHGEPIVFKEIPEDDLSFSKHKPCLHGGTFSWRVHPSISNRVEDIKDSVLQMNNLKLRGAPVIRWERNFTQDHKSNKTFNANVSFIHIYDVEQIPKAAAEGNNDDVAPNGGVGSGACGPDHVERSSSGRVRNGQDHVGSSTVGSLWDHVAPNGGVGSGVKKNVNTYSCRTISLPYANDVTCKRVLQHLSACFGINTWKVYTQSQSEKYDYIHPQLNEVWCRPDTNYRYPSNYPSYLPSPGSIFESDRYPTYPSSSCIFVPLSVDQNYCCKNSNFDSIQFCHDMEFRRPESGKKKKKKNKKSIALDAPVKQRRKAWPFRKERVFIPPCDTIDDTVKYIEDRERIHVGDDCKRWDIEHEVECRYGIAEIVYDYVEFWGERVVITRGDFERMNHSDRTLLKSKIKAAKQEQKKQDRHKTKNSEWKTRFKELIEKNKNKNKKKAENTSSD